MSKLTVIGICGKARSGKDTVAQHLVQNHGFFRMGLADGVRSCLTDIDGPTWEIRKELESAGKTSRWALQTIGTECRNDIMMENHWIDHLLIKIRFLAAYHPVPRMRFVIPDLRFPRERDVLQIPTIEMNGEFQCWMIQRPDAGLAGEAAKHASETSIDAIPWNQLLENRGTLSELRQAVDHIMDGKKEPS